MADLPSPFAQLHAPLLWDALLTEFGRTISYAPRFDASNPLALDVVWKEGALPEGVSPGRYSEMWVQDSDVDRPQKGDIVTDDASLIYDVQRVDATAYGYSRLLVKERN